MWVEDDKPTDRLEKAFDMEGEGYTQKEIADALGTTRNAVKNALHRHRDLIIQHQRGHSYEDKKEVTTVAEYWDLMKQVNEVKDRLDSKQTEVTVRVADNRPIGIAHWGDWHHGERGTDLDSFERHKEIITSTDGLYWIGMGDYSGNYQIGMGRVSQGVYEAVADPEVQDQLVIKHITDCAANCVALIRGCHDDWQGRSGRDFIQTLADKADTVNLWHGGDVYVEVGGERYHIHARHKYKYESSLNTTNAHRHIYNRKGEPDIAALAHLHFGDIKQYTQRHNEPIFLRSGSYKKYDDYGQKLGGYSADECVPMVILWPDRHHKVGFLNIEDGVGYLRYLRQEAAA